MGVPKFFRYISERYPCLSEMVKEHQIPAFDNLYLDMNGIIHPCSHPDDSDPTFRITEEKIFLAIFNYIEMLFRMIKPQKVFFMAVDGVAPRAKMNQQRGRRFRSAKEVEKQEREAREKMTEMPTSARFDSNCITPGTLFMTRLHEQLKYFVASKISTDKLWQRCTVILSGHETPGEGEHKIMDYIRYLRSQPGYDPNTRHCLYGLDADLIMLGLCSHEPHFSLLREEVKFGKKNLRKTSPENTTFFLLHLSLMREYLEQEFISVADKISFKFDLEHIIDDWVLMGFLVGNDFIPHLPNLHVNSGALPILYNVYMKVLPELDGYLNESGTLNLPRFQKFMNALASFDYDKFEDTYSDLQYFESKTGRRPEGTTRKVYRPTELTPWEGDEKDESLLVCLEPENNSVNKDLAALIQQTDDMLTITSVEDDVKALNDIFSTGMDGEERDMQIELEFRTHKRNYYCSKMGYNNINAEILQTLAHEYVRAIQWILNYYYNGVCSWSWFYPDHYAPYISDIRGFANMELKFDFAKPFLPYEQLLAVLPPASKDSLPTCFHFLMTNEDSPIKDFYPDNFDTDLNGKRQEWEAVVLIPFIDEKRLIDAMASVLHLLSPEEFSRNAHGPMLVYRFSEKQHFGPCSAPAYFPTIPVNRAAVTPLTVEAIRVPRNKLVKGVLKGTTQGVYFPGFPTTKHLKYRSKLYKAKVKVFEQPSREDNMVLVIEPPPAPADCPEGPELCDVAAKYLGKIVFVRWPHLIEAKVVAVSDRNYRYNIAADGKGYNVVENLGHLKENFDIEKHAIESHYMERRGIDVSRTTFLIHVVELIGRKYAFLTEGKVRVNLEKQYAQVNSTYPLQTVVLDIAAHDDHRTAFQSLDDVFKHDSVCFMLGQPHYGAAGKVIYCKNTMEKGRIMVCMRVAENINFTNLYAMNNNLLQQYYSLQSAATTLAVSQSIIARITGTILVARGASAASFEDASKVNVGLNLKSVRRNQAVPGYVKNIDSRWYYSERCLHLIDGYRCEFFRVFQYLSGAGGGSNISEEDVYPEDKGSGETLKKIQAWISKQPHSSIEMQNCNSNSLESEVITELEKMIDVYTEEVRPKNITMKVKPHLLHIPGLFMGNVSADPTTSFEIFDRVVNIRESYTVPVGYTGTVISVHKLPSDSATRKEEILIDVLYDKPFTGGLAMNCSANRGFRMAPNDLINKSHGDRQLNVKLNKETPNYPQYKPVQIQEQNPPQNSAFVTWNNANCHTNPHVPQNIFHNMRQTMMSQPPPQMVYQQSQQQSVSTGFQKPPMQSNQAKFSNVPYYPSPPLKPNNIPPQNQSNSRPFNGSNIAPVVDNIPPRVFSPNKPNVPAKVSPMESPAKVVQGHGTDSIVTQQKSQEKAEMQLDARNISLRPDRPGTDMLRNILRVNEKENQKMEAKASSSSSVDNFFQMAQSAQSNQPQSPQQQQQQQQPTATAATTHRPAESTSTFASAQLLSFFVAHGMGCPMYSYSELHEPGQAALHRVEVQIPTNQGSNMVVVGPQCRSRDAATEIVAEKTLERLKTVDLSIFLPKPPQFPSPPKQWCTEKPSNPRENNYSNAVQHEKPKKAISPTKSSARSTRPLPTLGSVPFVPLQVSRKHFGKPVGTVHMERIERNCSADRSEAPRKVMGPVQLEREVDKPKFQQVDVPIPQQKPKAKRQMRLAAKFPNMPT